MASWSLLPKVQLIKAIHRPAQTAEFQTAIEHMALSLMVTDGDSPLCLAFARRKTSTFAKPITMSNTLARKAGSKRNVRLEPKTAMENRASDFLLKSYSDGQNEGRQKIRFGMLNVKDPSTG